MASASIIFFCWFFNFFCDFFSVFFSDFLLTQILAKWQTYMGIYRYIFLYIDINAYAWMLKLVTFRYLYRCFLWLSVFFFQKCMKACACYWIMFLVSISIIVIYINMWYICLYYAYLFIWDHFISTTLISSMYYICILWVYI